MSDSTDPPPDYPDRDWRLFAISHLTAPVGPAYKGGPSHEVGSHVTQSSLVKTSRGEIVSFSAPSAIAMALNVAARASDAAEQLRSQLQYKPVVTPEGAGQSISSSTEPLLYDFFEQAMVAAVFSYQALEAFANQIVMTRQKDAMAVEVRGKRQVLNPAELERRLSTAEKLHQVLPKLIGVATPKGKKVWEEFIRLESARDSTIHLKVRDQLTVDQESLYFRFLSDSPTRYPIAAAQMLRFFHPDGSEPRWLRLFMAVRQLP